MNYPDRTAIAKDGSFQQIVQAAIVKASISIVNEVINDVQTITTSGIVTGGTFSITYAGQTTAAIRWNASAGEVQTTLAALTNIGANNIVCTGGPLPGTGVAVNFCGSLSGMPISALVAGINSLTGTGSPAPVYTHTTIGLGAVNHASRASLATKILNNPPGYASLMSPGVIDSAVVQGDWVSNGASFVLANGVSQSTADTNVTNQVSAIFNSYT